LTADAAWPGAPTHLLIHSTLGSATNWLDTIRPLTACGRVIAPDLPGTLAGHTASPPRSPARADQRPVPPRFHGHARARGRGRARLADGRPGGAAVRRPRTRACRRARARGPDPARTAVRGAGTRLADARAAHRGDRVAGPARAPAADRP